MVDKKWTVKQWDPTKDKDTLQDWLSKKWDPVKEAEQKQGSLEDWASQTWNPAADSDDDDCERERSLDPDGLDIER